MKTIKKSISYLLAAVMLFCTLMPIASAADNDYRIVSPYEDIIWEGENAQKQFKGNLHTHSTVSDASVDYPEMVKEYYNQGFDFLAMTDHGVTGKEWNKKQTQLPLYLYQYLLGYTVTPLTDEEYYGIINGTYPLYNGAPRGSGMTCVVGGNELCNMTLTKSHVNGFHGADLPGCISRKVYYDYPDKRAALAAMTGPENLCPTCGRQMQGTRWFAQPGRRYMDLAACPEHGQFLIRVRLSDQPDGTIRVSRLTYEATSEAAEAYARRAEKADPEPRPTSGQRRRRRSKLPEKKD